MGNKTTSMENLIINYIFDPVVEDCQRLSGDGPHSETSLLLACIEGRHEYLTDDDVIASIKRGVELGFIAAHEDEFAETFYEITKRGEEYLNIQIKTPKSVYSKFHELGEEWLLSALKNIRVNFNRWPLDANKIEPGIIDTLLVPASDRLVTLDDNKRDIAIEALDNVIEAVRGDNEYGSRDPEGKEQRLAELAAGKKLLEAARASISTVDAVLIKTLAYLSGIGVAVEQIADAMIKVKSLLGL